MKRSEYHGCIFGGFFFGGGKIQVKTAEIPLVNAKLGAVDDEMRDEQNKTSTLQEAIKVWTYVFSWNTYDIRKPFADGHPDILGRFRYLSIYVFIYLKKMEKYIYTT